MVDSPAVPTLPPLEGWVRVDESTDRLFQFGLVTVRARTVVYEDETLRTRVATSDDGPWRFLFASRLVIRPRTPMSKALTQLVLSNATSGLESRLRTRGFSNIRRTGSRTLAVEGGEAEVVRYDAAVETDGVELAADAYLAVTPVDGEFLLTGGAYPREVVDGDEKTAAVLREAIDPERFREELFEVIRRVE
ncbi:hypothetical protein E6P09_10325 [Haloferax mediterranei ATCC 33500]|uniref:Uncharacterized protein n=1 Tax=Haloferax mediterranei (strain ATCC 33500 / DSM 1411 / JCM 8866 / NBRC 14739 / NCIMB 2177 / R-4) TaxID=523841 RepID=I3R4K8_HALMT|nr:DUF6517 family protein [Haloferax mediterranei]AFK19168.1 hypothetical protein HFX_1460 [Haloferax mediterranei ATCC 33500]AHZ21469.1 hypothetical protein BM92_01850 [Haloferax mediterranei ATCC 33500]EMA03929.1 hypothetical protein C439_03188 [Haloferax mediterranei ATCC 33500]MDX5989267.1 DUF6517 family protein [Haloferax mediterranei ATCC 33500]QCQ75638.1 hypothetical protein E6P09_10325 [Haloferax mediterranei ATCC 33500]